MADGETTGKRGKTIKAGYSQQNLYLPEDIIAKLKHMAYEAHMALSATAEMVLKEGIAAAEKRRGKKFKTSITEIPKGRPPKWLNL